MMNDDQARAGAERRLHQIIELLDEELGRMEAEAARKAPLPDPARRSLRPHELN